MEEKSSQGDLNDIVRAGSFDRAHTSEMSKWGSPHQQLSNPNFAHFGCPVTNFTDPLLDELSGLNFIDGEATNSCAVTNINGSCDLLSRAFQVSPLMARSCTSETIEGYDVASQRNLGLRRRKSQARKVVCIPAVTSANVRPGGGEVVPSDLWAWRKYGQKPIKGSPYPRGYYRCSSSKDCSARKQVERSRTDANMLVITYTSEHNHPWPTQRNALAGSTRSYISKSSSSNAKGSSHQSHQISNNLIEETTNGTKSSCNSITIRKVKEEEIGKTADASENELHRIVEQIYDNTTVDSDMNDQSDALLEDVEEIDPLGMFTETKVDEMEGNSALDPFELLNWVGN